MTSEQQVHAILSSLLKTLPKLGRLSRTPSFLQILLNSVIQRELYFFEFLLRYEQYIHITQYNTQLKLPFFLHHMTSRRRDKTPILHRLENQPRLTSPNTPNIYQRQFERDKQLMLSQERASQQRRHPSKYKKNKQKKSADQQDQRLNFLVKQNSELRKEIVELKVHQFYQFDDKKLKGLLTQIEQLRKQVKKTREQLEDSELQNQFFRRTNKQLQAEIQKIRHELYVNKKSTQVNNRTIPLSPKMHRSDEQLTDAVTNHNSNTMLQDVLETYKTLGMMDSKSTQKKERLTDKYHYQKRQKKAIIQQRLLIQSRAEYAQQRMSSPRVNERLSTSPRQSNQYFTSKAKKKNYQKS